MTSTTFNLFPRDKAASSPLELMRMKTGVLTLYYFNFVSCWCLKAFTCVSHKLYAVRVLRTPGLVLHRQWKDGAA